MTKMNLTQDRVLLLSASFFREAFKLTNHQSNLYREGFISAIYEESANVHKSRRRVNDPDFKQGRIDAKNLIKKESIKIKTGLFFDRASNT